MADFVFSNFGQDGNSTFQDVYIYGTLHYDFDDKDITFKTLNITGKSIFQEDVDITGNLNVNVDAKVTGITTVNNIEITGTLKDGDGDTGSAGQILSSDGTDLEWINASSANVGSASKIGVNLSSNSNDTMFLTFVDSTSGNEEIRVDKSLTYKPSAGGFLGVTTFASLHVTGGFEDTSGDAGSSGQVLSATGVAGGGTNWINVGDITAGTASSIAVTANSANKDQFIPFLNETSGSHQVRADAGIKYNPNTNALTSGSFVKSGGQSTEFLKADGSTSTMPSLDDVCDISATTNQNITTQGTLNDGTGNVREIVNNSKTASYTLIAGDVGKLINTNSGVTVPSGVFSAGQAITIYNNSGSSITITQGSSVTMRLSGTSTTGNRTLAQRGICTVVCVASNNFVASGAGLS